MKAMVHAALCGALLAAGPLAYAQQGGPTDPQIAAIVVTANQVDIDAGRLAESKTHNPDVRSFAERMVTDCSGVNQAAVDLAPMLDVDGQLGRGRHDRHFIRFAGARGFARRAARSSGTQDRCAAVGVPHGFRVAFGRGDDGRGNRTVPRAARGDGSQPASSRAAHAARVARSGSRSCPARRVRLLRRAVRSRSRAGVVAHCRSCVIRRRPKALIPVRSMLARPMP
ncbi:putative membrane protein [Burkholderia multivorans]